MHWMEFFAGICFGMLFLAVLLAVADWTATARAAQRDRAELRRRGDDDEI